MGAKNKKMMPGHLLEAADDIMIQDATGKRSAALAVETSGAVAKIT